METTIQSATFKETYKSNTVHRTRTSAFWEALEFNRYGIIAMVLVIIGCAGGIAVAFGAGASLFEISLVAFPTIVTLAIVLAVSPMKMIVWASMIAILMDIIVLVV
jgi:hypothetical protein